MISEKLMIFGQTDKKILLNVYFIDFSFSVKYTVLTI